MFASLGVVAPFDLDHRLVSSPLYSSRTLAFQRLVLSTYGCATVITSLTYESVILRQGNIWFSFFTHLALIGLTAYLIISAYHTFHYKLSSSSSSIYHHPLQRWHKILQALHILLMSTVTTFPILVTTCYWALIASPETFATSYETWAAISVHILNTVFALTEITTTNIPPLPWMALPVCLILLLAYLAVAYITHATEGVYTYPFLDPQTEHAKLAIYIIGIAVGESIIFVLVHYAIILRDRISKFSSFHDRDMKRHEVKREALGDWEEAQRDDGERSESAGNDNVNPNSGKSCPK